MITCIAAAALLAGAVTLVVLNTKGFFGRGPMFTAEWLSVENLVNIITVSTIALALLLPIMSLCISGLVKNSAEATEIGRFLTVVKEWDAWMKNEASEDSSITPEAIREKWQGVNKQRGQWLSWWKKHIKTEIRIEPDVNWDLYLGRLHQALDIWNKLISDENGQTKQELLNTWNQMGYS